MRSLKYLSAVLPLFNSIAQVGANPGYGGTVIVTTTRTVTICPIETFITTCDSDDIITYTSRSGAPTTTTTKSGEVTTTTTTSYDGGHGGNGTTTTSHYNGNGTTSSTTTTTTTTSGCFDAKKTVVALAENKCNDANDRTKWCGRASVKSDTHTTFKTGDTKKFTITITDGLINPDGAGAYAGFLINGKTPGEAIEANWGDMVEVTVVNGLAKNATTIHWHGILQYGTNDQDGVPGVTECGIAPGQSRVYTWHASTFGTGWYHSHLLAQYGGGIRGPIIIHGPASDNYDYDMGHVMIDEKLSLPVFDMAKKIASAGPGALPQPENVLFNGKNTQVNGTGGESLRFVVKQNKKHLFRIINSSAQSGFIVEFDKHNMTVVSADFTPIQPYSTYSLHIHAGQRYNVIVEANQEPAAYYLRAINMVNCGFQNKNNGKGVNNAIFEYENSCNSVPAFYQTTTVAEVCVDEPLSSLKPVVVKAAGSQAAFDSSAKLLPAGQAAVQDFGAPYGRIVRWFMGGVRDLNVNNSAVSNKGINVTFDTPSLQLLNSGIDPSSSVFSNAVVFNGTADSWYYFVIQNTFATSHPMHLHGHDFAILGQEYGKVFQAGDVSKLNFVDPIRRDTALLYGRGNAPNDPGYTVIGFPIDNPGAWVMHCHIMWHAEAGMGMQFLERPSDISQYSTSSAFQDECSALKSYEAVAGKKTPYEAGIKRHLNEHKFHGHALHA